MTLRAHFEARRPRYQVIAEELAGRIGRGEISEGELLPSEARLCAQHGVSRHTVREAIRALADLGLVDARAGIGTRVLAQKPTSYVQRLKEIADLNAYVSETSRRVIARSGVEAREAGLELPGRPDARWAMLEAVRETVGTGAVIAWTRIYVRARFETVFDRLGGNELVYQHIEREFGLRTDKLAQDIYALPAPDAAAGHLGIEPGSAALAVARRYFDEKGEVFEATLSIHPPLRYRHSTEFRLTLGAP